MIGPRQVKCCPGNSGWALTMAAVLLLAVGCAEEATVRPHALRPAEVVFLGWDCCRSECPPDTATWVGAIGRVRNVGELPAYHVLYVTRPCSTCYLSGSFGGVDRLDPGREHLIHGVWARWPANCPVVDVCWTTDPDSLTHCPRSQSEGQR